MLYGGDIVTLQPETKFLIQSADLHPLSEPSHVHRLVNRTGCYEAFAI